MILAAGKSGRVKFSRRSARTVRGQLWSFTVLIPGWP